MLYASVPGVGHHEGPGMTAIILMSTGLGEAVDAMVKLCVMRGQCLSIYIGNII